MKLRDRTVIAMARTVRSVIVCDESSEPAYGPPGYASIVFRTTGSHEARPPASRQRFQIFALLETGFELPVRGVPASRRDTDRDAWRLSVEVFDARGRRIDGENNVSAHLSGWAVVHASWSTNRLAGGRHRFRIRVTDEEGNVSPPQWSDWVRS